VQVCALNVIIVATVRLKATVFCPERADDRPARSRKDAAGARHATARCRSILPRRPIDEALDVTRIYSVADQLPPDTPLVQNRPFRAPHHTISHAGLVDGAMVVGELSLDGAGVSPHPQAGAHDCRFSGERGDRAESSR